MVQNPTLAVLPTLTATPTQTLTPTVTATPSITPTPTQTPTPTVTPTRRPTFTPIPEDPAEDCAQALFGGVASAVRYCKGTDRGDICYGSWPIQADPQPNYERNLLLPNTNSFADIADVRELRSGLAPTAGNWGVAYAFLPSDLNGALSRTDRINMVVLGGSQVRNLVDHPQIQEEYRAQFSANSAPRLIPPFTRLQITTDPAPDACGFMPTGVIFQATTAATLEINGIQVTFDGTIHITGVAGAAVEISNLERDATLGLLGDTHRIPMGATARVPINSSLEPRPGNILYSPLDATFATGLYERAAPLSELLDRPLAAPPDNDPGEVALLNSRDGEWTVATRVTFLAGLYLEGDNITTNLASQVVESCSWRGAWLLTTDHMMPMEITELDNGQAIRVNAYYPDVVFPQEMTRVETDEESDRYIGTAYSATGAVFEHQIEFDSARSFKWQADISGLGSGLCGAGQVRGDGSRPPAPPTPLPSGVQFQSDAWRLRLFVGAGYVPSTQSLPDCPQFATFTVPTTATILSTALQDNDRALRLQTSLEGIPLPAQLTAAPQDPDRYFGVADNDVRQVFHEVTLNGDQQIVWRMMLRSVEGNCREGVIEAIGSPLG